MASGATLISEAFKKWKEAAGSQSAHMRLKQVITEDSQVEFTIGSGKQSFLLTYPEGYPSSSEPLTVFSAEDELSEWNMHMMEYCEKKRSLEDIFNESAKAFRRLGPKSEGKSKGKKVKEEVDEGDDDLFVAPVAKAKKEAEPALKAEDFFTGTGSKQATDRLIKDLQNIMKSNSKKFGYSASPVNDNLYQWQVQLFDFDPASDLAKDLKTYKQKTGNDSVILDMKFPATYPFDPPFIRVVRPRFQFRTGHVTIGGSICMQLLTRSGWLPSNDIESILVQIRSEMMQGNARLDLNNTTEYSEQEAKAAFDRVARDHGWQ